MRCPYSVSITTFVMEYIGEKVLIALRFPVYFYCPIVNGRFVILGKLLSRIVPRILHAIHLAVQTTKGVKTNCSLRISVLCTYM